MITMMVMVIVTMHCNGGDGEEDVNGKDDNGDDCRAGQCWQRRRRGSPAARL